MIESSTKGNSKHTKMANILNKIVILGDSGVGKTALLEKLVNNRIPENGLPTVGAAYFKKTLVIDDVEQKFQFWDTAGAERYRSLNSVYYHNAPAGIFVFDLTSRESFLSINYWVDQFTEFAQPGAGLVIVGNKSDLKNQIQVDPSEGEEWAKAHDYKFFTTSARTGENVNDLAEYVSKMLLNRSFSMSLKSVDPAKDAIHDQNQSCC